MVIDLWVLSKTDSDCIAFADTAGFNVFFLSKCVSPWAKLFGLFSRERKEREIVEDLVKLVNEEVTHQAINRVYTCLPEYVHHNALASLHDLLPCQYHAHVIEYLRY